ncbi:tRNA lysidine(34) synthetase TilS [Periweissella fabalis]|uniref:tRNA(Ile)-lysidine synthase n=1 Tax=Periweissella fabalis TaxID=1070421 RepID=A0A7X6N4C4_9LACO|nr:tRNA lysidine(34) synthetase TilS [Periweissella fabalis]NKZ24374.1 tRNA lysidine(34) synthetase TilS [Periweissella fabalis]
MKKINIVKQIQNNIEQHQLFESADILVVAASAGVDSQVLLESLAQIHDCSKVIVVHINHDMRPQAADEAEFVAKQAASYGFSYEALTWIKAKHPQSGVEAAGRTIRYQFLKKIAHKYQATKILTAHHANDLAETFLMKLFRGGRWEQLASIRWSRTFDEQSSLVRPMLNIPKAQLIEYAKINALPWFEDESNQDLIYTRNRIRNTILPQIMAENGDALNQINQYAKQISDVDTMIKEQVSLYLKMIQKTQDWQQIPRTWFQATLKEYLAIKLPNVSIKQAQLQQIEHLYYNVNHPNGRIRLNQEYELVKTYKKLDLLAITIKANQQQNLVDNVITLNEWYLLPNGGKFIVKQKTTQPQDLNNNAIIIPFHLEPNAWPLHLRNRKRGDKLTLKNGHQKVTRVLIDAKVPIEERDLISIMVDAHDQVLWVVGYKANWVNADQVNYEVHYIPEIK